MQLGGGGDHQRHYQSATPGPSRAGMLGHDLGRWKRSPAWLLEAQCPRCGAGARIKWKSDPQRTVVPTLHGDAVDTPCCGALLRRYHGEEL
jgi:hypothetical protein